MRTPSPAIPVWDPLVRIGHWLLVVFVAAAWLTHHGWGLVHEWLGYVAVAIAVLRGLWGWAGPRYARFSQFVWGPAVTLPYARDVLTQQERRYLGHNPLGGWMIVALLGTVIAVCVSGWVYTTDAYWGVEWVERLHDGLSNLLILLIALHIGGVIFASLRHRENLAAAMIHGHKRPAQGSDVA